jgi:hypothetical protein
MIAARSIPDRAAVFQEWTSRRMEMASEDAKHLAADAQKFVAAGTRLMPKGWSPNGQGDRLQRRR